MTSCDTTQKHQVQPRSFSSWSWQVHSYSPKHSTATYSPNIPLPETASLFTPRSLYSTTTNVEKNSKEWWERHKWKNRVGFAIRSFLFKTLQPTLLCPAVHRSLKMPSQTLKMI
jgi:hypothetical protein